MNEELFRIGMKKDRGLKRKDKPNQDSIKVVLPPAQSVKPPLLILSDGMGGYGGGEIASDTTVRVIEATYLSTPDQAMTIEELITLCINEALGELRKLGATDEKLSWMGCTVVMAALYPDRLVIANVGDSRAYRISSAGDITQISYDHSLVAEQLRHGLITTEEAQNHPRKNVLSMSLSARREGISPYIASFPWEPGDSVLLCSDGLWGPVPEDQIESVVSENTPQAATEKLIQKANENKGPDNISVIIARYHQSDPVPSEMTIAPEPASSVSDPEKNPDLKRRIQPVWVILAVAVLALIAFFISLKIENDRLQATATAEAIAATETVSVQETFDEAEHLTETAAAVNATATAQAIEMTKTAAAQATFVQAEHLTETAVVVNATAAAQAIAATETAAAQEILDEAKRRTETAVAIEMESANQTSTLEAEVLAATARAADIRITADAVLNRAYEKATAAASAMLSATPTVTLTEAEAPTQTAAAP